MSGTGLATAGCFSSNQQQQRQFQVGRRRRGQQMPRKLLFQPVMASKGESKGIFAPLVVMARNVIGAKRFNALRGKGIALHSQVINEFCKSVGADGRVRQGLIRVAKKNGEKLGFLA